MRFFPVLERFSHYFYKSAEIREIFVRKTDWLWNSYWQTCFNENEKYFWTLDSLIIPSDRWKDVIVLVITNKRIKFSAQICNFLFLPPSNQRNWLFIRYKHRMQNKSIQQIQIHIYRLHRPHYDFCTKKNWQCWVMCDANMNGSYASYVDNVFAKFLCFCLLKWKTINIIEK